VSDRESAWLTDKAWQDLSAQDILVPREKVAAMEVVQMGRRAGLTLTLGDGSHVWLWLGQDIEL
jgi:hypothetical protein